MPRTIHAFAIFAQNITKTYETKNLATPNPKFANSTGRNKEISLVKPCLKRLLYFQMQVLSSHSFSPESCLINRQYLIALFGGFQFYQILVILVEKLTEKCSDA